MHLLHACPDALRADLRRVYGLDLDDLWTACLRPSIAADLAANLPPGSLVWRRLDVPAAWTPYEYLLAVQVDQMNMWMWGNADRRKRGPRPDPVPRPGNGHGKGVRSGGGDAQPDGRERRTRTIRPEPMTLDEFRRWRAQRFRDSGVERNRPMTGE